jgi:hypothetical protein
MLLHDLRDAALNRIQFAPSVFGSVSPEGERLQREIVDYAHLNRTAVAAIKTIIETASAPSNGKATS